jgi:Zn finger protein HypA/HybF involved in hydrogenase expression
MQIGSYLLGSVLGLMGLLFLIASGSGNTAPRVIIGVVLLAAAAVLVWLGKVKSPGQTIIQNIDLPGNTTEEQLHCKACGGTLNPKDITVQAGAVFVKCPYCGTSYQLEEAPKW